MGRQHWGRIIDVLRNVVGPEMGLRVEKGVGLACGTGGIDRRLRSPYVRPGARHARPAKAPPPRPADRRLAGGPRSPGQLLPPPGSASSISSFVRDWARELYAERGRPTIDPVVFFKLQLVMFFEGIRSERQLIETASLNLAHRWYLGYALDEELPDHSSLTRIRQRLGHRRSSSASSSRSSTSARRRGWSGGGSSTSTRPRSGQRRRRLARPALLPRGQDARRRSVRGRARRRTTATARSRDDDLPARHRAGCRSSRRERRPTGDAIRPWRLLEERRLDPNRPPIGSYRRTTDFRVSPTDPDATPMRDRRADRLGYHDHYVVDGGKARIILAALVTPADVMENLPMLDLLWRVCFRWKLRPHQVTGDTTYGTVENIVAVEDAGIRAYVPLPDLDHRTPFFGQGDVHLRRRAGRVSLPAGPAACRCRKTKYTEETSSSTGPTPATCNACPVKAQCTTSDHGRTSTAPSTRSTWRRVRGYHAHRGLPEGDAQAPGLGRAAVCRGQGLAWLTAVPAARLAERQHRGAADRGRPEPEALARPDRLGATPVSKWSCWGRPLGPPAPAGSSALTAAHRPDQLEQLHRPARPLAFFNRQGRYGNREQRPCSSGSQHGAVSQRPGFAHPPSRHRPAGG